MTRSKRRSFLRLLSTQLFAELIFLGATLLVNLYVLFQGWTHGILDQYGFRQAQTAISVDYLLKGGNWLRYETPVLGPPWNIPFEFPLYQWIVAGLSWLSPPSMLQIGRAVSAFFYYSTLFPLYFLLGELNVKAKSRLLCLALFLISPLYIFWSRTFMIESCALFFSLSYLSLAVHSVRTRSARGLFLSVLCGALGALVKVTTFFGFALALAVFFLNQARFKEGPLWARVDLKRSFHLFAWPSMCVLLWTKFADFQKQQNPLAAHFITSKALTAWNFGTLQQRLSSGFWVDALYHRSMLDIAGSSEILPLLIVLSFFASKARRGLIWISLGLFIAVPLVFTNLHFVHGYYPYANGIFFLVALGLCCSDFLHRADRRFQALALFLIALLLVGSTRRYVRNYLGDQLSPAVPSPSLLEAVNLLTPADSVLLIYGEDWSSALPFYLKRRSLMDRDDLSLQDPKILSAFANLKQGGYELGGALICKESLKKPWVLANVLQLNLKNHVRLQGHENCELYFQSKTEGAGKIHHWIK